MAAATRPVAWAAWTSESPRLITRTRAASPPGGAALVASRAALVVFRPLSCDQTRTAALTDQRARGDAAEIDFVASCSLTTSGLPLLAEHRGRGRPPRPSAARILATAFRVRPGMQRLSRTTADPFRGSEAVREGRLSERALRGSDFVALAPDVYVGSATPIDTAVRIAALSVWSRGAGVVAGPLAALGWNVECPWDDADLVLRTSRRIRPGRVRVRVDHLPADEIGRRYGVAVTSPQRTAFDLGRRDPLPDAVAAVDALAHRWRFGAAELLALLDVHPGVRGVALLRRVVDLMDPRVDSLMESRIRVGLVLRGVPRPVCQHEVLLPNGRTAHLDLAWPDPSGGRRPLAIEYDGEPHRTITAHGRDLTRQGLLDDIGWDVMRVTARQVYRELDVVAVRVLRKLGL